MFNPIIDIDRRIEDLQRLKETYNKPQQPINIYNNTSTSSVSNFEARILKENEKVDEILVQNKTCFIDLKNGFIAIKEINGDIQKYDLILPKDEKDLKIEELERRLMEYEQYNNATSKKSEPSKRNNVNDESSAKGTGSNFSK